MNPDGTMNILLLGSGGREAAMAWKMRQSPLLGHLYIAPGNGGTTACGTNLPIDPCDAEAVDKAVTEHSIDMVVGGSEAPLVAGLRDKLLERAAMRGDKLLFVGPGADGAALEGSKDFAKRFMGRHNIPTARHLTVTKTNVDEGRAFLRSLKAPYVLKADGLAAGKGVLIIDNLDEAIAALDTMLDGQFGAASASVVIEQFLKGIECSVFVLTDGSGNYRVLPVAKDYKRIGEGDTGLNTGGMGAVSPVPFADETFMQKVTERIIEPTLSGLRQEGIDYRGFIFLGLINCDGDPYVIEYNVRMGDPETETVMTRIVSDFVEALRGAASGNLEGCDMTIDPRTAVGVMAVSGGYPGSYAKGKEMTIGTMSGDIHVFHAGTKEAEGKLLSWGGRVIDVVALADDIPSAAAKAYDALQQISFEGMYFRRDIGKDLL